METASDIASKISLRDLSGLNESFFEEAQTNSSQILEEAQWRLSHLKEQFSSFKLDILYEKYTRKLNHGYFSLFLILETLLTITHLIIVVVTNKDDIGKVLPDVVLYTMTAALAIVGLSLVDRIAKNYRRMQYVCLAWFGLLVFVNFFVPIYHRDNGRLLPAYSPNIIIATYLFFCIERFYIASAMGLFVGIANTALSSFLIYDSSFMLWRRLLSDISFCLFLNLLGLYYRYMNEIVTRRSFLDRRDCIMSTHQLRHEQNQMEQLMNSILPEYVLNKVKENYIKATRSFLKTGKNLVRNPFDASLLDTHENVAILFADIVRYTEMTIRLDITELLETLNDLFTLFDAASLELKVSRIKFLGDCYYCVAGLPPDAASNPAEACVDLGLKMISIISAIKKDRNLDIDMRIGVHNGKIIAGTIGSIKYQFDIWSKDVEIANKMESEGCAGKVHITNKTEEKLKKNYYIDRTNKGKTVPQFKQMGLTTYLVSPTFQAKPEIRRCCSESDVCENHLSVPTGRSSVFKKRGETYLNQMHRTNSLSEDETIGKHVSFIEEHRLKYASLCEDESSMRYVRENLDSRKESTIEKLYKKRISVSPSNRSLEGRRSTNTVKRRTAFMNNNIKRYTERTEAVNTEIDKKIEEISFSKYRQYMTYKDITPLLLFRDKKIESEYLKLPDPLFKYYLLGTVGLILNVYLLQNLTLKMWDWKTWTFLATASLILFGLVPLSWAQSLYHKYISKHVNEPPKNKLLKYLCAASKQVTNNYLLRISIFSLVYLLFSSCVLVELIDCKNSIAKSFSDDEEIEVSLALLSKPLECVLPWHMTQTCVMTVVMSFLFLRIFIWLKLVYGCIVLVVYSYCVIISAKGYYAESASFNHSMPPQIAHILGTVFLTLTLHLVDRQTDYMNRSDYLLNREVKFAQEEANELQKVNEILLLNILPKHVAKVYLDVNREPTELYYEDHNDAVVMFASIIMDDDLLDILEDYKFLSVMNAYIHAFDTITNRAEFRTIEKIKIAKWTYMVACGLNPGGKASDLEKHYTTSNLSTLLSFASEMFKKVEELNRQLFQEFKLRIGVSHGAIVAGVVGSKKPLYDIWGNPVNMASRMDSTGIPNNIQVLEETAEMIQKLGYECVFRGSISVKGRSGLVKTFFVKLNDQFDLVRIPIQKSILPLIEEI